MILNISPKEANPEGQIATPNRQLTAAEFNSVVNAINTLGDSLVPKNSNLLSTATRVGDTFYNVVDRYTEENTTYSKVANITDEQVDGVVYIKVGSEYFKRNFTGHVNVDWFGAVGDGITDDTAAIQAALRTLNVSFTLGKTYIINQTLVCLKGTNIIGNGAVIKSGENITGTLKVKGRYFFISGAGVSDCIIDGLKFQKGTQSFDNDDIWEGAVIGILAGATNNTIQRCLFDFDFAYGDTSTPPAVLIGGNGTNYNKVSNCFIKTLSITYCMYSASYNTIEKCTILNCATHAIGGGGHDDVLYAEGNRILNNTIINVAGSGITDWMKLRNTIIEGNTIIGTGKFYGAGESMGISAVGYKTKILNNTITDYLGYGIEARAASGFEISGNILTDLTPSNQNVGIILNNTPALTNVDGVSLTVCKGNTLNTPFVGIAIQCQGATKPAFVNVKNNTINDPIYKGVSINFESPVSDINIEKNVFRFTVPNTQADGRYAVTAYAGEMVYATAKYQFSVERNFVIYDSAAGGGVEGDIAFYLALHKPNVQNNTVYGSNITSDSASGSKKVKSLSSKFWAGKNWKVANNAFLDSTTDAASLETPLFLDNELSELGNATNVISGAPLPSEWVDAGNGAIAHGGEVWSPKFKHYLNTTATPSNGAGISLEIGGFTNIDGATAANATVPHAVSNYLRGANLKAANTNVTYNRATAFYIAAPPSADVNVTINEFFGLFVEEGKSYFGDAINHKTAATPATPPAGEIVEWWNGTTKNWKKPDGTTGGYLSQKAAAQADSTATDIAGLVTDFNALLAKMRTAGILST